MQASTISLTIASKITTSDGYYVFEFTSVSEYYHMEM